MLVLAGNYEKQNCSVDIDVRYRKHGLDDKMLKRSIALVDVNAQYCKHKAGLLHVCLFKSSIDLIQPNGFIVP